MLFGRAGTCFAIAGVFVAFRLAAGLAKPALGPLPAIFLFVLSTALVMLLQLSLAVSITSLRMRLGRAVPVLVVSGALVAAAMLAPKGVMMGHAGFFLPLGHDLFLMVFAATAGYLISHVIREPNILFPATLFAGLVDLWGVTWGPLSYMLEHRPAVVESASVQVPSVVTGMPMATIGMGDFLFLALFFGVLYRFSLNVMGAFWWGYVLLTVSILFVLLFPGGVAIPALVPMVIAILVTNLKHFKLKRQELLATLYVGAFLLVLMVASAMLMRK